MTSRKLFALPILLLCCCWGMAYAAESKVKIKLKTYIASGKILDSTPSQQSSLTFPTLDVYSPQGRLIFHGKSLPEIDRFTRKFPGSSRHLDPIPNAENLDSVVSKFPMLGPPSHAGCTFLIVSMEDCEACSLEQEILTKAERRLHAYHADIRILALEP